MRKNIKANDEKWLGKKFHKLKIVDFVYKNKRWLWKCECECGKTSVVYPNQVIRGKTTSCGCNRSVTFTEMHYKHGKSGTRIYKIWKDMRRRCNINDIQHNRHYGDRGISVCDEWEDFDTFYEWAMENGYNDKMSIERIDVNGNYTPNNCKWIPVEEQTFNTRKTINITIGGISKPIGQWADELGLKRTTVYSRMRRGATPKEALGL